MTLTPLDADRAVGALAASAIALWAIGYSVGLGDDAYVGLLVWVALFVVAYLALYALEWWLTLRRLDR